MSKIGVLIWRHVFESGDEKRIALQHPDISELEMITDIPYIDDGERGHLLDIYRRKDHSESDPIMINIHGGGLFASYKEVNKHFNYEIAKMGYQVISISYRRIPETTLWHQIDDVMNALRFIEAHLREWGMDPDRVYISGDSSGALLSLFALSLNSSQELQTEFNIAGTGLRFRAAAMISIMLDTQRKDLLMALSNQVCSRKDRGTPYRKYLLDPSLLLEKAVLPPVIQFTSEEDLIQKDSVKFCGMLEDNSIEHEFHNYPKGTDHELVHVFPVMYPDYPESREVYSLIDAFCQAH